MILSNYMCPLKILPNVFHRIGGWLSIMLSLICQRTPHPQYWHCCTELLQGEFYLPKEHGIPIPSYFTVVRQEFFFFKSQFIFIYLLIMYLI